MNLQKYDQAMNVLSHMKEAVGVIGIDIPHLIRLIKVSEKESLKVEGKDIVLLLGTTGSGKSTFLHFICGSKMEKVTTRGVSAIVPTEVKNK